MFIKKDFTAEKINDFFHNNIFWLSFWLIFGAVVCAINKYDFLWDFQNYHVYNPWKFWDGDGYDIVVPLASINSFFNPLIDLPLYLMIKYLNDYPSIIHGLQGLWFGALIFSFQKIVLLFFNKKSYRNVFCVVLAMGIAITGQATWFQAGSSTNEVPIAFMIMLSVYYILKLELYPELQKTYKFFWIGILMGLALGLKQTSLTYSFAIGFTMLIFYKHLNNPYKSIGAYILGGFIGCVLIYGYFMYENYVNYGNPILPFMNTFFKSEYFDDANFHDRRYMPDWNEFLYYPYLWEKRAAEIRFTDKRGAIFYTISWIFAIYALVVLIFKRKKVAFFDLYINRFTSVYMLISYLVWSIFFSIFRYLIPLEMFFAIFIVKLMDVFLLTYKNKIILFGQIVLLQILLVVFFSTPFLDSWGRMHGFRRKQYLSMEKIKLPENTLVKLYNLPIGIIVPLLARDNPSFKAVIYVDQAYGLKTDFTERNKFGEMRDKAVQEHDGPVVMFGVGHLSNEVLAKNRKMNNPAYSYLPTIEEIEARTEREIIKHYKREKKRKQKNIGPRIVDDETLEKLAGYSSLKDRRFVPSNAEIKNSYCRPLEITSDTQFFVCVPTELKDEILDPQVEVMRKEREIKYQKSMKDIWYKKRNERQQLLLKAKKRKK